MAKTALSAAAIGSRISLKESGIQQEFIVYSHRGLRKQPDRG